MTRIDFAVGIGGENGQGIASTGDILARIFARRGLHVNAYNAYQSIIRGGHTFLTIRAADGPVRSMGDKHDVLIPLNQDSMDRHLRLMKAGSRVVYDSERLKPGEHAPGVQLCPMPMKQICGTNKLAANTAALGAVLQMLGIESEPLEAVIARQFKKKVTLSLRRTSGSLGAATIMPPGIFSRFRSGHPSSSRARPSLRATRPPPWAVWLPVLNSMPPTR